jgi:hypothetical protein
MVFISDSIQQVNKNFGVYWGQTSHRLELNQDIQHIMSVGHFFVKISIRKFSLLILLLLISVEGFAEQTVISGDYRSLLSQYQSIKPQLQSNQFGVPVFIRSKFQQDIASGEVYALINHDFDSVAASLGMSAHWCDVVLLHINVKGCDIETQNDNKPDQLVLYVGRRQYQTPDEAHEMHYRFHKVNATADYLHVDLTAGSGPFGTSNYLLTFEVIPFNNSSSFIHFKYSYHYGLMAKLAIDGYLATIGRHKVGFTIVDHDEDNQPIYVQGLQGIVERNSMRYFLAIRSFLDTAALSSDQWEGRISHWYQLARDFERQFLEVREKEYLDTKRREFLTREQMLRTASLRLN